MELERLETDELLQLAGDGNEGAVGPLFARHRNRLRRLVAARLDRRVAARLDPSDVVQEALGEASEKLAAFVRDRPVSFYTWLKRLTLLRLSGLHRFHLGNAQAVGLRGIWTSREDRPPARRPHCSMSWPVRAQPPVRTPSATRNANWSAIFSIGWNLSTGSSWSFATLSNYRWPRLASGWD